MRTAPVFGHLIKELGHSNWFAGVNYLWMNTKLTRTNAEFYTPDEMQSVISRPGILLDYDNRDNDLTTNKGLRWNTQLLSSVEWLGSDYSFHSVNTTLYAWIPVSDKFYMGFRTEYQHLTLMSWLSLFNGLPDCFPDTSGDRKGW